MYHNFARHCLTNWATIYPLDIPLVDEEYVGICNPSIFIEDNRIRMILRQVNYALWNCDDQYKFTTQYGPLWYITPNEDMHLKTKNCLCELTEKSLDSTLIDTSKFDQEPIWDFVGLEDARLVRWNGKLYGTGVRRDTTPNGQGRMELSELDEEGHEISRVRIKAPGDNTSYCEKNWMPILDMPYHYVKWCNPIEIVKANPTTGDCETVLLKEQPQDIEYYNTNGMGIRGSSQVIPWGEYRIAITHMCELWMNEKNQKSGTGYFEQFIVWDKDWNIVKISEPFTFAHFGIEFTNGLAFNDGKFYIPFALQDNFSFLLVVDEKVVSDFIFNDTHEDGDCLLEGNILLDFFNNPQDSYICMELGKSYFRKGYYAPAMVLFERACEYNTFISKNELYDCIYMCGKAIAVMGQRDDAELGMWNRLVNLDMYRSEGYVMLARYYGWRGRVSEAYMFAKLGYQINNYNLKNVDNGLRLTPIDGELEYIKALYYTENYLECQPRLEHLLSTHQLDRDHYVEVSNMLSALNDGKKNKVRIL